MSCQPVVQSQRPPLFIPKDLLQMGTNLAGGVSISNKMCDSFIIWIRSSHHSRQFLSTRSLQCLFVPVVSGSLQLYWRLRCRLEIRSFPIYKTRFIASCTKSLGLCHNMISFTCTANVTPLLPFLSSIERRLVDLKLRVPLLTHQVSSLTKIFGLHTLTLLEPSASMCHALMTWIPSMTETLTSVSILVCVPYLVPNRRLFYFVRTLATLTIPCSNSLSDLYRVYVASILLNVPRLITKLLWPSCHLFLNWNPFLSLRGFVVF